MANSQDTKKHAKYSASSSKRWLNCFGASRLIEKCPPSPESIWAIEGTRAHRVFEIFLRNRTLGFDNVVKVLKQKAAAKEINGDSETPISDEMISYCKDAAESVVDIFNGLADPEMIIEERVDLSFVEPNTFGTGDVLIIDKLLGSLHVIDLKAGAGLGVEVEEYDGEPNSQLAFYALGALYKLKNEGVKIEDVTLTILQPRAFHEDGPVRSITVPAKKIWELEHVFRDAIAASKAPDAPLKSGSWCQFCPATSVCPEISARALERAQVAFKDDYTEMTFPDPLALTPEVMSKALAVFPQLKFWMKEVEKRAMEMLNVGMSVPGFKLVQKRGRRIWTDPVSVLEKFKTERPELLEIKIKTPAQVEKLAKDLKPFVKESAVMFSSGVTLAPDKDKREAVQNAQLVFDEWADEGET